MKKSLLAAVVAVVAVSGCRTSLWAVERTVDETRRQTPLGEVVGGEGRYDSYAWLGIPFAQPPVDELRWKAPQPAKPWKGTLEATAFKPVCAQVENILAQGQKVNDGVAGSEDCLYVNVWAPKGMKPGEKLPVMVWFHGGGNSTGGAPTYDLGHLASSQRLVMVSVQYRLGPLGWFRHAALAGETAEDASGNYGTLDLVESLKWVQQNIGSFGGDAGKVTVFGESAGGANTYAMLLSPKAKGLFHRAIAQSPTVSTATLAGAENFADDPQQPGHRNSSNEVLVRLLAKKENGDVAKAKKRLAEMSSKDVAKFLRKLSPAELFSGYSDGHTRGLKMIEMPVLLPDGVVLPAESWVSAFSRPDGWNQMPVITGTNRDEAKLFLFLDDRFTWKLMGVIPRMRDENRYLSTASTFSRLWRAQAVDAPAAAMRRSGAPDVYVYRFDWDKLITTGGADLNKMLGAAHGLEIPFVHGHDDGQMTGFQDPNAANDRKALSQSMMAYWGTFAREGKPGNGGLKGNLEWLPYDTSSPEANKALVFDAKVHPESHVEEVDLILADAIKDTRIPLLKDRCASLKRLAAVNFLPKDKLAGVSDCREFRD